MAYRQFQAPAQKGLAPSGGLDDASIADLASVDTAVDAADVEVDAAKVLTAALETDTIAVDASVDGNKVLTAALETDTIAVDASVDIALTSVVPQANVDAVQAAMDDLQADGAAPTEAHVDTADAAWDVVVAALATAESAVNDIKTLSAALETDAIAADADVDATKVLSAALETDAIAADAKVDDAVTASQAAQAAVDGVTISSADVTITFNLDTVTSQQKAIAALRKFEDLILSRQGDFPIAVGETT